MRKRLKVLLIGLILIGVLIFVVGRFENWRGQKTWKATLTEVEAADLQIDWNEAIPKPVPDEENLVLAPIMNGCYRAEPNTLPKGTWRGEPRFDKEADQVAARAQTIYAAHKPSAAEDVFGLLISENEMLDVFGSHHDARFRDLAEIIAPYRAALAELRAACAERPESYLPGDYSRAVSAPIPNFEFVRPTVRLLTAEALLALREGDSELALDNCRALKRISNLNPQTHFLTNIMVEAIALRSHLCEILWYGLSHQAFTAEQLKEVRSLCKDGDVVRRLGQSFAAEARVATDSVKWFFEDPVELMHQLGSEGVPLAIGSEDDWFVAKDFWVRAIWYFIPAKGWHLQMLSRHLRFYAKYYNAFDLEQGRVDLAKLQQMADELEQRGAEKEFFDTVLLLFTPSYQNVAQVCVDTQRRLDLLGIAAQLMQSERKGHALPETLTEMDAPTDPETGEPYLYQRTDHGFRLSSPGKDQTPGTGDDLIIELGDDESGM